MKRPKPPRPPVEQMIADIEARGPTTWAANYIQFLRQQQKVQKELSKEQIDRLGDIWEWKL